jgi:15-cis-phytoene synthase
MNGADPEILPPEAELALAWTPPMVRSALTTVLQLDRRLARIVARTTEPMLGQMRLAWWREALTKPVEDRPRGDVVLDAIGQYWAGREAALAAMVDGWEVLITADRLGPVEAEAFGAGRGAFFAALCENATPAQADRAEAAGFRWATADAVASVTNAEERAVLIAAGLARDNPRTRWPKQLRGLAVLDALAMRALQRGGCALMEGRGASLVALRAAIFLV